MRLASYLFTAFTSSERELEVGVEREMEELAFFDKVSYCISVFIYNFGSGRIWKLGRRDVARGRKSVKKA